MLLEASSPGDRYLSGLEFPSETKILPFDRLHMHYSIVFLTTVIISGFLFRALFMLSPISAGKRKGKEFQAVRSLTLRAGIYKMRLSRSQKFRRHRESSWRQKSGLEAATKGRYMYIISRMRRCASTAIEINIRCVHSANWRAENVTVRGKSFSREDFEWQATRL